MKLAIVSFAAVLLASAAASGQEPTPRDEQPMRDEPLAGTSLSFSQMSPTPEMWFYDQALRQYNDPKQSVRRKAEFMADQRRRRLAAMAWFGYSNSRPVCNPTPYTGTYSPMWVSNTINPSQWGGATSQPVLVIRPVVAPSGVVYGLW